ncbi:MAG TPA: hypothetical protein VG478_11415 [Acidimicrobiales bacterium]|jgi:hypothetical protein|nr:hypothetical protein [Acidimicrobiales bacterium]
MGRLLAKCSGAVLAAALGVLLTAPPPPARADPPAPGDVRSTVSGIEPPAPGVVAEIVGGDSFLRLRVQPGREVVVAGYEDEPYLRFSPDGTVEANRRSPAATVNESRFGAEPDPDADSGAPPAWEVVATDGSYEWHDHRAHWMAAGPPEPPERAWTVPITIDGQPALITGVYRYEPPPRAWPRVVVAIGLAIGLVVAAGRWRWVVPAAAIAAAGGVAAYGVALARLPGGTTGVVTAILGGLAAAGAVAAAVGPRPLRGPLLGGAGAALLIAGWQHADVLSHSVLTTAWPEQLERLDVAVALACGAAAIVTGVRQTWGVYQPPGTSASASAGPQEPRT